MPKVTLDNAVTNVQPEFAAPVAEAGETDQQYSSHFRGRDRLAQVAYDGVAAFIAAEFDGTNNKLQDMSLVGIQTTQASIASHVLYTSDAVYGRVRPLESISARIGLAGAPTSPGRTEIATLAATSSIVVGSTGVFDGISAQVLDPTGLVTYTDGEVTFTEHQGFLRVHLSGGLETNSQPIDIELALQQEIVGNWVDVRWFAAFTLTQVTRKQVNYDIDNVIVAPNRPYRVVFRRTDGGPNATLTWVEPSIDWKLTVG